jgi:hypothetical protein
LISVKIKEAITQFKYQTECLPASIYLGIEDLKDLKAEVGKGTFCFTKGNPKAGERFECEGGVKVYQVDEKRHIGVG